MDEKSKQEFISYIDKVSVVILGLLFILFPVFFFNLTTDFFVLPKQALLLFAITVFALLFGIKNILEEKIKIRRTPFDLAVVIFLAAVFLSSVFSTAIYDSLQNFVPFLFAGISFFAITQGSKDKKSFDVLLYSLLGGTALASVLSSFTFLKIYLLPFSLTNSQTFTTLGTIQDQAIYFFLVLILGLYFLAPYFKNFKLDKFKEEGNRQELTRLSGLSILSIIILIGLIVSIYGLLKVQQPVILPLETGFQTAFAAISQDSGRILQGLLFGTGFGEYFIAFSKFKQASFNLTPYWSLSFFRSSTFALELLATTGILGFLAFLFLCYKAVKEKPLFVPLLAVLVASFLLPFSFYHIVLLFFILGLYASYRGLSENKNYFDVELQLVALKKGFLAFSLEGEESAKERTNSKLLSYTVLLVILIVFLGLGYLSTIYLLSNINFEKSLVAASQNNGSLTYTYQTNAVNQYPKSDVYQRVFAQTNLSLANSLASSVPNGATPSAQTTQTVYTLVQQAINAARQATTLSPQNTIDWQNLATIYRSLIGFGQNADSFSVLAQQQAVSLDPNDPQVYITLGGIYYQLGTWSKAQDAFQQAITLKPDLANAYYNLGHTYEQEGDLKSALTQFETVKSLVTNDPTNLAKINGEISTLQNQINSQGQPQAKPQTQATQPSPIQVSSPSGVLPPQNPPVKIPAPTNVTATPTPTKSPEPSPTPAPTSTP